MLDRELQRMALAHPFTRECRVIEQAHVRKIVKHRLDDLRVKLQPTETIGEFLSRTRALIST